MSAWLPKQGVHSAPWALRRWPGARWAGRDSPGQHDGGAVGEVAGPGAVAEALQCEAKADEARADGEAELEQEAEQEVVLGLREEGGPSLRRPRPLRHPALDTRIQQALQCMGGPDGGTGAGLPAPARIFPSSVPPPPSGVMEAPSWSLPASRTSLLGKAQAHRLHFAYLLGNGVKVFPCCHRHDGAMGGLPQQRDAEKQRLGEGRPHNPLSPNSHEKPFRSRECGQGWWAGG